MKTKTYIIIVTYNDLDHIVECLNSLSKIDNSNLDIKTVVIDNASSKFNPDKLKEQFPSINLIKNKKNIGFGAANNIGLKKALKNKADYALLLNPDTNLNIDKGFLKKMIVFGSKNKRLGIIGSCIKHKTDRQTFYDYGGKLNLSLAQAKHINKINYLPGKINNRDFISAACMLIKKDVLEKGILFDEKYFLYLEDVDFCLQVKKIGYKIANLSSSLIFHYGGTSGTDLKKVYYSYLSSIRLTKKWTMGRYKIASFAYNSLFYSYLLISWSLKRFKRSFFGSL